MYHPLIVSTPHCITPSLYHPLTVSPLQCITLTPSLYHPSLYQPLTVSPPHCITLSLYHPFTVSPSLSPQDQNETLLQRLEHSESSLGQQLRQTREALTARSQELDTLKSEWTTRLSDLSCRHAQEMNSEREKAIKVGGVCLVTQLTSVTKSPRHTLSKLWTVVQ